MARNDWSAPPGAGPEAYLPRSRHKDSTCGYERVRIIMGSPEVPWFRRPDVDVKAMAQLKRWVSTNLRAWPVCQHGHEIRLVPIVYSAGGGDGELASAGFACQGCPRHDQSLSWSSDVFQPLY